MITRDLNWGVGRHTSVLARELLKLGNEVTILTSNDGGLFTNPNLKVNTIPFLKKEILKDCDVIHVQGSPFGAFLSRSGRPVVVTVHSTLLAELMYKKCVSYAIGIPFEFMTLRNSNALIAVNTNIAEELKNFYKIGNKRVSIIPNGVELNIFDPVKPKSQSEKIRILSGGRLEKRKGFDILINAMQPISKRYSDVEMVIFGQGPEYDRLVKQIHQLDLSDKITLTGFVQRNELAELYRLSDIFVCASFYESGPLTLVDAMSAGLSVISSNIPSVDALVLEGQTGLLFNTGDAIDLASKLSWLIDDIDLRRSLMRNARRYVEERASWEHIAKATIKVYEGVLK